MRILRLDVILTCLVVTLGSALPLAAQSTDKVKLDVLSALSTPLPITVVGPILTRDVTVTAEGDGFRATLTDATLMGIFPFGDISMKLVPLDDDRYRISEMTLPPVMDFPGFARLTHGGIEMAGTWSTSRRSYSDLHMALRDLSVSPSNAPEGHLGLGGLTFDVLKESDETDTESRFGIIASDVSVTGLLPDDVTVGEARALLAANGDKPVDLYSVIREVIMVSSMRDGGSELQALARSLLGNSYGVVSLDLAAGQLSVTNRNRPDERYFRAGTVEVKTTLTDVEPRHWGGADITVLLKAIDQTESVKAGNTTIDAAEIRLQGDDLPVGDMFDMVQAVTNAERGFPVQARTLLDGIAEFGRIGLSTEGTGLSVVQIKRYPPPSADNPDEDRTQFTLGYDGWSANLELAGLNRNEGTFSLGAGLDGGRFTPGPAFRDRDLPHVEAWLPLDLRLQSSVSNLNEAFLKKLFTDVTIRRLDEPVEILLPLALYAAATVFDISAGEDVYRTGLFRLTQTGKARLYPAKMLGLLPYEGEVQVTLSGIDGLNRYFAEQDVPEAASVLTVLRNLGRDAGDGGFAWDIARPDIERTELVVNGTTLRFPEVVDNLPMLMGPLVFGSMRF
ncbi:MAG: hypothetical protein R3D85_08555 [Paracoccaceae bacterium]